MLKNSEKQIPEDIDYDKVPNLASEARQKLKEVRPLNIAQAIRISGVNPSDISILLVYLRKQFLLKFIAGSFILYGNFR